MNTQLEHLVHIEYLYEVGSQEKSDLKGLKKLFKINANAIFNIVGAKVVFDSTDRTERGRDIFPTYFVGYKVLVSFYTEEASEVFAFQYSSNFLMEKLGANKTNSETYLVKKE